MRKDEYTVILFYRFINIKNPEKFREQQRNIAKAFGLKGRMFIAKEGVNATFEGTKENIKRYVKELRKNSIFKNIVFKKSNGNGKAFTKLQVKIRPEVVTLGAGQFDIKKETANLITAAELEKMYQKNEDFVVLDLRNNFEIQAGYFENTVHANLKNFRELTEKITEINHIKNKKVVAVCTGGIRCEKATCLLKREGFDNIYQLKDGIHTYIEKFPGKHFKGSLFVFDNRMVTSVVEGVKREITAHCAFCQVPCETFYNDDSVRPSKKVVCCNVCIMRHSNLRSCIPA